MINKLSKTVPKPDCDKDDFECWRRERGYYGLGYAGHGGQPSTKLPVPSDPSPPGGNGDGNGGAGAGGGNGAGGASGAGGAGGNGGAGGGGNGGGGGGAMSMSPEDEEELQRRPAEFSKLVAFIKTAGKRRR